MTDIGMPTGLRSGRPARRPLTKLAAGLRRTALPLLVLPALICPGGERAFARGAVADAVPAACLPSRRSADADALGRSNDESPGGKVSFAAAAQRGRQIEDFGTLSGDAVRGSELFALLDNLAVGLRSKPSSTGYVIVYGGRNSKGGEARALANRAKNYLVRQRRIPTARVVTVEGGYKEELTIELKRATE
jgi:hypothetical protein